MFADNVTYRIRVPARCWRPATCDEIGCPDYLLGWQTFLDEREPQHARLAYMIRHELKHRYTEQSEPGGLTTFTFEAGQACFKASKHKTRGDVMEDYLVLAGDPGQYRGAIRTHVRPAEWAEDFNEHVEKVATAIARG